MVHYHICLGPREHASIANVVYDDYEESIVQFVELANDMFRSLRGNEYDLSLEQALEATEYGESKGAYCGPPGLTMYWLRCEAESHSIPAWN